MSSCFILRTSNTRLSSVLHPVIVLSVISSYNLYGLRCVSDIFYVLRAVEFIVVLLCGRQIETPFLRSHKYLCRHIEK